MPVWTGELTVGVREEHELLARCGETGAQRGAVAAITFVPDQADARIGRGHAFHDRRGLIGAAVVDDEHLEVIGKRRARGERIGDRFFDDAFFVEGREEHRERGDACPRRGHIHPNQFGAP